MAARPPGDTSLTRLGHASSAYHEEQVLVARALENESASLPSACSR
jgi:hypothetical protein